MHLVFARDSLPRNAGTTTGGILPLHVSGRVATRGEGEDDAGRGGLGWDWRGRELGHGVMNGDLLIIF